MACAECRKLLRPRYMVNAKGQARAPEGSRFYRSISELRSSSTSCSICLALVRKLPPDAEFRQLWSKTVSLRPDGVACYMASLHESSQSTGTYQLILQLFGIGNRTLKLPMMAEKNQLVNSEFLLVPLPMSAEVCGDESRPQAPSETSSTTSSASSLDMAKGWLEKCLQHHPLCRVGSLLPETSHGPLFLPTRVIHILPGIIRLYTTSGSEGEDFRYATLSHRWPLNSDSILQLTTDNIGHWHSEIEQGDSFSQAFRDAIAVCKHLGIEYLWIDSLCIIQHGDGGQDWQLEAARMGAVYKHGLVNIAATSVADGEEGLEKGFFRSRAPSLVLPNVVTASCDYDKQTRRQGEIGYVVNAAQSWGAEPTDYHLIPRSQLADDVVDAPLNRRAWVVQERHLSPRILHFTKHQIFWECNETVCSETYPKADPAELFWGRPRSKTFLGRIAADKLPNLATPLPVCLGALPANGHQLWYELVAIYSRGGLTKSKDKLIAMSGIAREIMPFVGASDDDYVAGLWRQDLLKGLLWKTPVITGLETHRVRPAAGEPYQAPSWSWASVSCPVAVSHELLNTPHEALATIEEVRVAPKLDPFGEVHPGAYIRIKGATYKARLKYVDFSSRVWPELILGTPWGLAPVTFKISPRAKGSFAVAPDERFLRGDSRQRDIHLLPILKSKWKSIFSRRAWLVMLMLVPTGQPGEYERLGIVEITTSGDFLWRDLKKLVREETVTIV